MEMMGYNTTAVARYNAEYGTSGKPAVSNATFSQWQEIILPLCKTGICQCHGYQTQY
jgi:hypothetical protein